MAFRKRTMRRRRFVATPVKRAIGRYRAQVFRRKVIKALKTHAERKYVDTNVEYFQVDRSGNNTKVTYNGVAATDIVQGTAQGQRVGDKIEDMYVHLRLNAYLNSVAAAANAQHTMRVIIYQWNESTSIGNPSIGSVLQYTSSANGDYSPITSPINWTSQKQKDITILYDRLHSVGWTSRTIAVNVLKKCPRPLQFDAAATGTGHVFVLLVADDVIGAHVPDLQARYSVRLTYSDQ